MTTRRRNKGTFGTGGNEQARKEGEGGRLMSVMGQAPGFLCGAACLWVYEWAHRGKKGWRRIGGGVGCRAVLGPAARP